MGQNCCTDKDVPREKDPRIQEYENITKNQYELDSPDSPPNYSKIKKSKEQIPTLGRCLSHPDIKTHEITPVKQAQGIENNIKKTKTVTKDEEKPEFSLEMYENEKYREVFEIPNTILSRVSKKAKEMLENYGMFQFRLENYPGKNNPEINIHYDPDNIIFYGQAKNEAEKNTKEGKGFLLKNKNLFCGYFKEDRFDGPGLFILDEDNQTTLFCGYWKNDQIIGKAKMMIDNGYSYVGEWDNGVQSGYGEETWPDNSMYNPKPYFS